MYYAINSFNAGELSPKMLSRVDVSQYAKGCQRLQNFYVTPYGAVERRAGLKFIGKTYHWAGAHPAVRLIRFVVSSEDSYVCEFGHNSLIFYRNGSVVYSNPATLQVLKITTDYTADELDGLNFIQSADVMTIVHPAHPVMELKRTGENQFVFAEKQFEFPPVLEPNTDEEHTLTASAVSGNITLTASKDTFTSGNVGGFFEVIHVREDNELEHDFYSSTVVGGHGETSPIEVRGYWTFTTHGTWTGVVTLQRSYDGGTTWKDYRIYDSVKDSNASTSGNEEDDNVLYRVIMDDYEQSSTGTLKRCRVLLSNPDFVTTGVVRITGYTNARSVSGTVVRKLGGTTATAEWNEGAWSERRGFPRTVAFFGERMLFGGSAYRPNTVWGSHVNDWDNFLLGDKDDDGIEFALASDTVNEIRWLCQHDALVIGTSDSEWTLSSSDSGAALTPTNFRVKRQSVYGSTAIAACMAGETILFVQRGGRKVREFVYSFEKDGYVSPDLTILADHITKSGIRETALQQLPDTMLWCLLNDGTIAVLTYEREQEVVGWQRFVTNGKVESICVIPNGERDEVYMAVVREGLHSPTGTVRTVERLEVRASDSVYLDGFSQLEAETPQSSFSRLEYLAGHTVEVIADGSRIGDCEVSSLGVISLPEPASRITVGFGYESICSPMPIEAETNDGWSVLRKKAIGEVRLRFYDSLGGAVKSGAGSWQNIFSRDILFDRMDEVPALKTDVAVLPLQGGYEVATALAVKVDTPYPFNLTGMVATFDMVEK